MPHGDDNTWIQTFSGKQFWPLDPHVDDIDIQDIAHALAMKCRYTGHCREFYSVAEHSVRVAHIVGYAGRRVNTLTALLHDAAEAYTADVARPVKSEIKQFAEIEHRLEIEIAKKFFLIFPFPPEVKEADNVMLVTERRDLMAVPPRPWKTYGVQPLERKITAWSWRQAEEMFLKVFAKLT